MTQGKTHEGLISGDKLRGVEWYLCDRCAHAKPDWNHENLSLIGQPVQVWCDFRMWAVVRGTTLQCKQFEPNK